MWVELSMVCVQMKREGVQNNAVSVESNSVEFPSEKRTHVHMYTFFISELLVLILVPAQTSPHYF